VPLTERLLGCGSSNPPSLQLPRSSYEDFSPGWLGTWFYFENHEHSLPPFVGRLLEFQGTWSEEPTPLELPQVAALTNKINHLKEQGLTGVCVATHWLARRVLPQKKQVHPGWEYSGLQDPAQETSDKITLELLLCSYHIGVERDPVRHPCLYQHYCHLEILYLIFLNAGFGQLYLCHPRL
jgi:hypothetical protein